MLSGKKLKNAYVFSMAVGEGWLSWDVSGDLVSEHWTDNGLYFLWPKMAYPQELNYCVEEIQDLKVLFLLHCRFLLVFSLENVVGFLVRLPKRVYLQNIAQNVIRDAGWRSQMRAKWCFPPHPSCTYLKHNLPHHTIPKDTW